MSYQEAFPEFKEYYNELLMLRYKKKELVRMYDVYREALRAADEGTVQLRLKAFSLAAIKGSGIDSEQFIPLKLHVNQ